MHRTAAGDRDAFLALVGRHQAVVHRVLLARTRTPEAAEDALQETFLGAWRGASGYRGTSSVRAWLIGLARNQAARTHRRRAGEPARPIPLQELGERAGWGSPDPEVAAARAQTRDHVHAAMARLSPEDQEVLTLRDLQQLTGPEAAEALGLELRAMKSRLHRARLRLMAELRAGGVP